MKTNLRIHEIEEYINEVHYPAKKEQLLQMAEYMGADEEVVYVLEHMPDTEYGSLEEVVRTINLR